MKILNVISEAFRAKKAPDSAKLAELLAQTEAETAAARTRLAELEAKRSEMALASEADRLSYRSDLTSTRDDVADGEAAIVALRDKHQAAVESEAEGGRKRTHKAAQAKADELPGLIEAYAKAAQAVRDVIAKIADIDGVVRAANADLPAGAARIAGSSELRSIPAQPREILNEKTVDLWRRPGSSDPLPDEYQKTVSQQPDGTGYFPRSGGGGSAVSRGRFTRREYREARTAIHAIGFDNLVLPAAYVPKPTTERPVLVEHIPHRDAA
ncbi:hypothetical protein J8I29_06710 [Labrys sp. LIt4]|uniref:hypothetical protein n=1 Tax=Labrys sp. LIt4 TaxID=2821355 RepID=UPI001ADFA89B|nr:hypothetical protein [Labrys sp. LIt4]MBP0578989.1 hypothetical protein [Labrys sp. LIt4]